MSPLSSPKQKNVSHEEEEFSVGKRKSAPRNICACNCKKEIAALQKQLSEATAVCYKLNTEVTSLKANLTKAN